ncbi:Hypothetical protein GbCGDNIH3_0639 [Granulibacter bethesdensis]|uniref:Sulfotransferase family protein n=2 Tax=Granulibacter bethesdensis TaxID=364410 RepID=A0AAN0VF82_9PROT|nr:Hypothetical protein GbCGDNIH3_0639 [Granulibacter bethesdensis]
MPFDNRGRFRPGRQHLTFMLGGKRILYAYIRKNGCSSFKAAMGLHPETRIGHIPRKYKIWPFGHYDARIFVWRDPEARLVSLFRNKILDRHNAEDLIARYRCIMREEPSTFEKFAVFASLNGDPHVVPQYRHLHPIRYSHAIELSQLHDAMADLVGTEEAAIFRKPFNPSQATRVEITPEARRIIRHYYRQDYAMVEKLTRP